MLNQEGQITEIRGHNPVDLIRQFGSPLYVYDEIILRERCKQIKSISDLPNFDIYYSTKANSSITLLKIILSEGLKADSMSIGELYLVQKSGFKNDQILFMSNNVREEDFVKILQQDIDICVDSLEQLELVFKLSNGKKDFSIRINNNIADGHSDYVKTAGAVKFGIMPEQIDEAIAISKKFNSKIKGFFYHIGSFFLKADIFHTNVLYMLNLAEKYPTIEHIDFGGGFGVPYDRKTQDSFDIESYKKILDTSLKKWMKKNSNRDMRFSVQPGRFVVAECGICLCSVKSVKENYGRRFIGTDLGFNFFPRPMLYGGYHQVINLSANRNETTKFDVVGNICESCDVQAKDASLDSKTKVGDILAFRDSGAYCFSMTSNYVAMPRPAEILIKKNNSLHLIRKKESIELFAENQINCDI